MINIVTLNYSIEDKFFFGIMYFRDLCNKKE